MQMRHQPRVAGDGVEQVAIDFDRIDRRYAQTFQLGHVPQDLLHQLPEFGGAGQIDTVAREIDAGQHDLGTAALGERAHLLDHRAHRHRARIAPAMGDDAERAAMVATVLHLDEHTWQPTLEAVKQMRRHLPDSHDVADRDLFAGANIERGARVAPRGAPHLVVIADDAVDLGHLGEHRSLRLCRTAGHDDARIGPLAFQAPDRLPRLPHRLVGDRATVDDDGLLETCRCRLPRDHLGFERVEAAAEGDDLDAHATDAKNEGSNFPSYSNDAVPVISTWSSRSRHSMASLPPGNAISTLRLARFSLAAATALAQAAEPQALVSPAPRSQVRMVMWSRSTIWASVMLARSGKIG